MHREKPALNAGEWTYEERKTPPLRRHNERKGKPASDALEQKKENRGIPRGTEKVINH